MWEYDTLRRTTLYLGKTLSIPWEKVENTLEVPHHGSLEKVEKVNVHFKGIPSENIALRKRAGGLRSFLNILKILKILKLRFGGCRDGMFASVVLTLHPSKFQLSNDNVQVPTSVELNLSIIIEQMWRIFEKRAVYVIIIEPLCMQLWNKWPKVSIF